MTLQTLSKEDNDQEFLAKVGKHLSIILADDFIRLRAILLGMGQRGTMDQVRAVQVLVFPEFHK